MPKETAWLPMRTNVSTAGAVVHGLPDGDVRLRTEKSFEESSASVSVAPPAASAQVPAAVSCAMVASPACAAIVAAAAEVAVAIVRPRMAAHSRRIERRDIIRPERPLHVLDHRRR